MLSFISRSALRAPLLLLLPLLSACTGGAIVDEAGQPWKLHAPSWTGGVTNNALAQVTFRSHTQANKDPYITNVRFADNDWTIFSFDPNVPGSPAKAGVSSPIANNKMMLPEDDYNVVLDGWYTDGRGVRHWVAYCAQAPVHHAYDASKNCTDYLDNTKSSPCTMYELKITEHFGDVPLPYKDGQFTVIPMAMCESQP